MRTALFFCALLLLGSPATLATSAAAKVRRVAASEDPIAQPPSAPEYRAGEQDAGMSETSQSRIDAVLNTLKEILSSVQAAERSDASNYKCFMEWCDTEITTTNESLIDAQDSLEQNLVQVKEAEAAVAALTQELGNNKDERAELKDTVDQSTNLRNEERDEYDQESTSNTQALNQINSAIKIVGKVHGQGGFLQNGVLKRLQLNEPGESKYVLGIMKGLRQKLERTKHEIDSAEATKEEQYNEFQSTKKAQRTSLEEDYAEKQVNLNENKVSHTESKNDVEADKQEVKELKAYLREVQEQCAVKTREWGIKSHDRQAEKAALREAISFVEKSASEGEGLFAQEGSSAKVKQDDSADDDSEDDLHDRNVPAFLQIEQQSPLALVQVRNIRASVAVNSAASALAAAADAQFSALLAGVNNHEKKEGFAEAIKVVKDLIVVLQEQQKDENQKRKYCESELETKEDEKSITEEMLHHANAAIEKQTTIVQVCDDKIGELNRTNEQANANEAEAKTLRGAEKEAYDKATKDRTLAIKVLQQAKVVLRKFYSSKQKGGLTQVSSKHHESKHSAPPKTWAKAGNARHSVESQGAIMMLEKIVDDIVLEQKDAEKAEKTSEREYSKFMEDSRAAFDERMAEMTEQVTRKARVNVKLANDNEMKTVLEEELTSIEAQLTALHEECDQLLENHEAREKARFFEISQLRDVVDILSGSSVAARTGDEAGAAAVLLERQQPASRSDTALQELQDMSRSIDGLASKARALTIQGR